MKKLYPILLVLALALLAVAATFWRGQNQSALSEPQVTDWQNQATQQPPALDTAPISTGDQGVKEVTTGISKSLPISFNMPLSWSAVVDFYEGVLGGAAGPKNETTFRIALDENPVLIAGLGGGYPVVVYGINEKSEAKYRSFFENTSYEELSIAGATKVVRTPKVQGIGGYYQDVYIMRGNKIYVVGYDVEYTKVADKILQSWRFLQ